MTQRQTKDLANVLSEKKYELCTTFRTSNLDDEDIQSVYNKDRWPHEAGYKCLTQLINDGKSLKEIRE